MKKTTKYLFHKQTGMRYVYKDDSPMLRNPAIVVIDDRGNEIKPEATKRKRGRPRKIA